MRALLELDQYFVDEFTLQANHEFSGPEEYEIDWDIDFNIGRSSDGKPKFEVKLIIDVNQKEEFFRNSPYRLKLVITGYFHFPEDTDEDQIKKMIAPNGLAILYGVARNTVSQLTGVARFGRFLLPSINLMTVINNKATQEKSGQKNSIIDNGGGDI